MIPSMMYLKSFLGPWIFTHLRWSTAQYRPWCVWKLSSWVVASFVIPTWRFRRWGWNVMDGFEPLNIKSFWTPQKMWVWVILRVWKGRWFGDFEGGFTYNPVALEDVFFSFFCRFFCCVVILRFQSLLFRAVWRDGFLFCFFLQISSWMECQCLHAMLWTGQHELKCVDACGRHTKLTPVQKCTCRRPLKHRSSNEWWYFEAKLDAERLQPWEHQASVNESCYGKGLQKNTTTLRCKHCQSFVSPVINAQTSTDMWTM